MKCLYLLGLSALLCLGYAKNLKREDLKCGKCDQEACPKLAMEECLAGMVKDECGCCNRCSRMEGEPCDRPRDPYNDGPCGDELECKSTEFGTFCLCKHDEIVCGSDGVSYNNLCQLMAAARRQGKTKHVKVEKRGPCDPAAKIVTSPEFTRNNTGGSIVLACEAIGFPTPHVAWLFTRADNETFSMPGDDELVLTAARGGPGRFQVTGWIQIEGAEKRHEGDYTCVAQNKHKRDFSKARVKIIDVKTKKTRG